MRLSEPVLLRGESLFCPSQGITLPKFSPKSSHPEEGGRGHPQVPAFIPLSMEISLWRSCSRIPRKFPRNVCRTFNHNESILSAIG